MKPIQFITNLKIWNDHYLFYILLVANLIPVFSVEIIHTLDGPSHLYNAEIIRGLWSNNELLSEHYQFTPGLISNWFSHLLLAVLGFVLPAWLSTKVIFLLMLVGLPLAYRQFIKTIRPKQIWMCFWIFPFTYSFPLMMGFFNFCLALIPFFLLLNFWIKHQNKLLTKRNMAWLFVGLLLTYYAHLLVFVVLMIVLSIQIFVSWVHQRMSSNVQNKVANRSFQLKSLCLLIAGILPTTLTLRYTFTREPGYQAFQSSSELINGLFDIKPLVSFNPELEAPYNNALFILIGVIFLFVMIRRALISSSSQFTKTQRFKHFFGQPHDFLGWAVLVLLVMYFLMPDTNRNAGFISLRLALFAFLMLLAWLASQSLPRFIGIICTALGLYIHMNQLVFYQGIWSDFDDATTAIVSAGKKLPPNQVIISTSYYDNWLYTHADAYLGVSQPQVILNNYEAETGYFPTQWKDTIPEPNINAYFDTTTLEQSRASDHLPDSVDWVFVLGRNVDFDNRLLDTLYARGNRQQRNIIIPYGILIPAK